MNSKLDMVISPRERDLGGFNVRRILPYVKRKTVGPFIFFDHMGPAEFAPSEGMDVRPHPHIGLATVTYLFEGSILHRDSLGSTQLIQPGAVNWMTAGKGIVHSERTPRDLRDLGSRLSGIQCWVALPKEHEETDPSFVHHPADTLPQFEINGATLRLLVGTAYGRTSPVRAHSDLFYLEARLPAGTRLHLPTEGREAAAYLVEGHVRIGDQEFDLNTLAIVADGEDLYIEAIRESRVMLFGGAPLEGSREIWWNFVSTSKERIEKAKAQWREGKFPTIPEDHDEFIPLPDEPGPHPKPPGTIM